MGLLLAGVLFVSTLAGCLDDEEYSTSAADRLEVSLDTVRFDTVVCGERTNTYTFEVYNRTGKAVRIERAALAAGSSSPFSVNADGTWLESGAAGDLEISAHDSMRVFLNVLVPDDGTDAPKTVSDVLSFTTEGGAVTSVVLTACGQPVTPLHALRVEADMTLEGARPFQVFDSLVVAPGATLTLAAGTRLYFHPDASLIVRGTLRAEGSSAAPIIMRGDRLGYMFNNQPYDRIPAQWGGVVITEESSGSLIDFCDIHSGTFGLHILGDATGLKKLTMTNSIVHNMGGDCIYARGSIIEIGNCQITNARGNCVTLHGGDAVFTHCTIANFYPFTDGRGVALDYSNYDETGALPLTRADFLNCIITGFSSDEIMGSRTDDEAYAFNYRFVSSLLNTPEIDDAERIVGCQWDRSKNEVAREENFTPAFDYNSLSFSFRLASASLAVGCADYSIAATSFPLDLNGNSRLTDGAPDAGCYECQPE